MSAPSLDTLSPEALDLLFSTDPMDRSDAELDALVLEYTRRRNSWASAEAVRESRARKPRAEPLTDAQRAVVSKPASELTLDDLEDPA